MSACENTFAKILEMLFFVECNIYISIYIYIYIYIYIDIYILHSTKNNISSILANVFSQADIDVAP